MDFKTFLVKDLFFHGMSAWKMLILAFSTPLCNTILETLTPEKSSSDLRFREKI